MTAYYNEIDPYCAQWLRNLINAGILAPGDVDERSIEDVKPTELAGYNQCHFFAGVGVWSYALRLAGWPDERPVWTGSCPCQPFSAAGKRAGTADERHLWPAWFHLIVACRPGVIFGEQVESKDGLVWLDLVQTDLEGSGYTTAPVVLPVAGYGAPHPRHRIIFVADTEQHGWPAWRGASTETEEPGIQQRDHDERLRGVGRMADSADGRCQRPGADGTAEKGHPAGSGIDGQLPDRPEGCRAAVELGDASDKGSQRQQQKHLPEALWTQEGRAIIQPSPLGGFWADAEWIWRRHPSKPGEYELCAVEPGTFPMAHRTANHVGRLRAYGNAISPWPAKAVIESYLEDTQ